MGKQAAHQPAKAVFGLQAEQGDYIPGIDLPQPVAATLVTSKRSRKLTPFKLIAWLIVVVGVLVAPAIAIDGARAFQSSQHISAGR